MKLSSFNLNGIGSSDGSSFGAEKKRNLKSVTWAETDSIMGKKNANELAPLRHNNQCQADRFLHGCEQISIPQISLRSIRFTPFRTAPNMFAKVDKRFDSPKKNSHKRGAVQFDDLLVGVLPEQARLLEGQHTVEKNAQLSEHVLPSLHERLSKMEKTIPAHRIGRHSQYFQSQMQRQRRRQIRSKEVKWNRDSKQNDAISRNSVVHLMEKRCTTALVQSRRSEVNRLNASTKSPGLLQRNVVMNKTRICVHGRWIELVSTCGHILHSLLTDSVTDKHGHSFSPTTLTGEQGHSIAQHDVIPLSAGAKGIASSPLPSPMRNKRNAGSPDYALTRLQRKSIMYMVRKFAKRSEIDHRVLVAAVFYLQECSSKRSFKFTWDNLVLMFSTALMLAHKFHEDVYAVNEHWANCLKISLTEKYVQNIPNPSSRQMRMTSEMIEYDLRRLVAMEQQMLAALDWNLYVTSSQMEDYIHQFYSRVC